MPRTKKATTEEAVENKVKPSNLEGPQKFSRDDNGLLKNTEYVFNDDGSINWRAMIKDEHLFPNRSWFQSRNKDVPRTSEGLADHQLLIKLGGIKELARLRGFSDVAYEVIKCEEDHVAVICKMNFIPNYETGSQPVAFQDIANATLNNTSSFATKFLETIACNRAFVRCVRNFLNVHIVGDDEMDKSNLGQQVTIQKQTTTQDKSDPFSPSALLSKKANEILGCNSFADFREHIRSWWEKKENGVYQNPNVKDWDNWSDISAKDARNLLGIFTK